MMWLQCTKLKRVSNSIGHKIELAGCSSTHASLFYGSQEIIRVDNFSTDCLGILFAWFSDIVKRSRTRKWWFVNGHTGQLKICWNLSYRVEFPVLWAHLSKWLRSDFNALAFMPCWLRIDNKMHIIIPHSGTSPFHADFNTVLRYRFIVHLMK